MSQVIEEYEKSVALEIKTRRSEEKKRKRFEELNAKFEFLTREIERVKKNNFSSIYKYFFLESSVFDFYVVGLIIFALLAIFYDGIVNGFIVCGVWFVLILLLYFFIGYTRVKRLNKDLYLEQLLDDGALGFGERESVNDIQLSHHLLFAVVSHFLVSDFCLKPVCCS